ncbi:hypothetical protein NHX12_027876 [Muraenolepis orangiensis]|uniref:Uncharacterized protein n=1 Tax=Muraenolepis orangiensis TaxID=630683 RepID=A0A9Q0IMA6_9TELE|nr:hypothetical protein NHX12_027876 [Muraenolepis orangiensis]
MGVQTHPHLSPFAGEPPGGRAPAQAAADPDGGLGLAGAVGGGEGLGVVTALTQDDAMLEARPTLGNALKRGGGGGEGGEGGGGGGLDQSRVVHCGGQDWLLQGSRSMGRWVRQWLSSTVSSSAGPIRRMHSTVLVLTPPSHVLPHSDQTPMNHLGTESHT